MAKNTSILLGEHFESFINNQIQNGRFASASEVIRAALRLFEEQESSKSELVKALRKGEKSGFIADFDRSRAIESFHKKHYPSGR